MRKVGVKISGALTRLFKDCGYTDRDQVFTGAVDLGQFAKARNAAANATVGLADLTASVLHRFLARDPSVHVSMAWDTMELSPDQVTFASTDIYASWCVFQALTLISTGEGVSQSTPAGTAVSLYSTDHSLVVAHGHVTPDQPKQHRGVNVTKTRILVTVTLIINRGHIVPGELLASKKDTPLTEFPAPPFTLLCKAKHLRTRTPENLTQPAPMVSGANAVPALATIEPCATPLDEVPTTLASQEQTDSWFHNTDIVEDTDQLVQNSVADPPGAVRAHALNVRLNSVSSSNAGVLRSRVLGDIFHLMHQFPISMRHGLRRPFARALRDAFFIPDAEDKEAIETFLASRHVTWQTMFRYYPRWLFQRVRRFVPPPDELLSRVSRVVMTYGPLKDSITGQALFNDKAWEIADNALENIRRGYYSDPPNIPLYYTRSRDKYGLLRYKCRRGTNGIEGGVHQNIIRWFGSFNAAPDFALQLLRDYVLYHNLKVCWNDLGQRYVLDSHV